MMLYYSPFLPFIQMVRSYKPFTTLYVDIYLNVYSIQYIHRPLHCIISKTKYICQKILDLHNNNFAPIFCIKNVICSLKNERLPFLFWGTFYCGDLISSDKFCVACHQGYSCHNALRYIRYVDISILYRTLPQEGAIHKLHKQMGHITLCKI